MKAAIAVILFVLFYSFSQASDTLYSYYTYKYDTSIKYVRKMVWTKDSGWLFLTHNARNILVAREYFDDPNRSVPQFCHYEYREETGTLRKMTCYKDGIRDGPSTGFNEKGDMMWVERMSKGRFISNKKFPGYDPLGDADHYFPVIIEEAWQKHLAKTFRYPQEEMGKNIQSTVVISFIVSEAGKLSDFRVEQSGGSAFDAEAIRVLKLSPDWSPAMKDGKKVSMRTDRTMGFKMGTP